MKGTANALVVVSKKIDAFFNFVSRICAVVSGILLVGVTLIIFAGVMNRSLFHLPWLFVEEYSALALIPISYLTMGYTLRWNQHLKMDIVVRNVPDRVKQIFGIFAAVFSLGCIAYMTISSVDWFSYTFERHVTSSGTLRTPLWPISLTIVFGVVLFAIDMFLLILHRIFTVIFGISPLKFVDDDPAELPAAGGDAE